MPRLHRVTHVVNVLQMFCVKCSETLFLLHKEVKGLGACLPWNAGLFMLAMRGQ